MPRAKNSEKRSPVSGLTSTNSEAFDSKELLELIKVVMQEVQQLKREEPPQTHEEQSLFDKITSGLGWLVDKAVEVLPTLAPAVLSLI